MVKMRKGIFGGGSGGIGNVSLSSWKGISYARKRNTNKYDPKTPAQQFVRDKMALLQAIVNSVFMVDFSLFIYDIKGNLTNRDQFVRLNFNNITASVIPDMSKFIISLGTGNHFDSISFLFFPGNNELFIDITRDPNRNNYLYFFLITNDTRGEWTTLMTENSASFSSASFKITSFDFTAGDQFSVIASAYDKTVGKLLGQAGPVTDTA